MPRHLSLPLLVTVLFGFTLQQSDAPHDKKPELPELPSPELPAPEAQQPGGGATGQAPAGEQLDRDDLVQRFPERSPFLGVWRISKAVRNTPNATFVTTGYVIFTKAYFSLHVYQQAAFDERRAFQSAMRSWRLEGDHLVTSSLVGVRSSASADKLLLEATGYTEKRRFVFLAPRLLRIYQTGESYLELIKVEDHEG